MAKNGWRKPTPGLVVAEKHAQAGERLAIPKTQAIVATKKIGAVIGLKAQDLLLLDTLGAFTQSQDWEEGRRPIVWASNNFLMDQTGFSLATLRRHVRRLIEAGVIAMKDSPNGKRWGKRDDDGYIVEAYGFDLAPLAARMSEFEALYAEIQEERQLCASLRNSITTTRRIIRAKIEKALEARLRGPWTELQDEFALLLGRLPRRSDTSDKLIGILEWFTAFKDRVEETFSNAFEWPASSDEVSENREKYDARNTTSEIHQFSGNMTPTDISDETHILITKQQKSVKSNNFENKAHKSSDSDLQPTKRVDASDQEASWDIETKMASSEIDVPMLMSSCPHFAMMARELFGFLRDWNDVHQAAGQMRAMAGISEHAWKVANDVLGPMQAAASVALIFDKHSTGEVQSPGGYLRAMVERAQAGELHLDRSFYGRLNGVGER